jgi:predicted PurR-regulated permease PerM
LDFIRSRRALRDALIISDPHPIENPADAWGPAAHVAMVGIFVLLSGAALYFCRPVLLPTVAAVVVGLTLAPIVTFAGRHGVSPWLSALGLVLPLLVALGVAASLVAAPVTEWIGRAPEIGALIKQRLYVLDAPLSALHELQNVLMPSAGGKVAVQEPEINMVKPVIAFITPAALQLVTFFVALLFFLVNHANIRRQLAGLFSDRAAKLRVIRIVTDIRRNLASYLALMTGINICLGLVVAAGAWLLGLPNPLIFGALAAVLNYIPYIGPACMVVILLGVGLVSFLSLGHAMLAPACFVALTTIEGQIVSPTILGARLPLSPFGIFLSLVFWAWLWGPIGAFLAVPLAIIGRVIVKHVFPAPEEPDLPE